MASPRHTCIGRKEVRGGQCLTPMSALRHFHMEDWGMGQILGVSSSHFFSVSNCLSGLLSLLLKQLTKELGEVHMPRLSLTMGHPSYFPLKGLKLLLEGNCRWDPITEIKARKAEAFISVTLASSALYKGSFSEDQEVSLRNWFSLRKKELGDGGGWETRDGGRKVVVTIIKQIRKLMNIPESWEKLSWESCFRNHIHVHYHVWALQLYKAAIKRSLL